MKLSHQVRYAAYKLASEVDPSLGFRNVIANLENFFIDNSSNVLRKVAAGASNSRFFYSKAGDKYTSEYVMSAGNALYKYLPLYGPPLSRGALEGVPNAYPNLDRFSNAPDIDERISDKEIEQLITSDTKIVYDPVRWYGINEEVNKVFNDQVRSYNLAVKEEYKLRDTAGRTDKDFLFVLRPLILATLINMRIHEQDKPDVVAEFMKRFLAPQVPIESDKLAAGKRTSVCKLVSLLKPSPEGGFATSYIKLAVKSVAIDYLRKKARQTRGEVFYEGSEYGRSGAREDEAFSAGIRRREEEELRKSSSDVQFDITEARFEKLISISDNLNPLGIEFSLLQDKEKYPTRKEDLSKLFKYLERQQEEGIVSSLPAESAIKSLLLSLEEIEEELKSEYLTDEEKSSLEKRKDSLTGRIEALRPFDTGAVGLYDELTALKVNLNYLIGYRTYLDREGVRADFIKDRLLSEKGTGLTIPQRDLADLENIKARVEEGIANTRNSIKTIEYSLPSIVTESLSNITSDLYLEERTRRKSVWDSGETELSLQTRLEEAGFTGLEYSNTLDSSSTTPADSLDLYYDLKNLENPTQEQITAREFLLSKNKERYDLIKSNIEKYNSLKEKSEEELTDEEKSWSKNYEDLEKEKEKDWSERYEKRKVYKEIVDPEELKKELSSPDKINFRRLMDRIHKNLNFVRLYPGKSLNSEENIMGRIILRLLLKVLIYGEHSFSLAKQSTRPKDIQEFESKLQEVAIELSEKIPSIEGESEDNKVQRSYKMLLKEPEIFFSSISAEIKPIDIQRFISIAISKTNDFKKLLTLSEQKAAEKGHLFFCADQKEEKRIEKANLTTDQAKLRKISNEKFRKLMEILYTIILISFRPDKETPVAEGTPEEISQQELWGDLKEHLFKPYKPESANKKRIVKRMEETYGSSNLFDFLAMGEKDDLKPTIFIPTISNNMGKVWESALDKVQKNYIQSVSSHKDIRAMKKEIVSKELEIDKETSKKETYRSILGIYSCPEESIIVSVKNRGVIYEFIEGMIAEDDTKETKALRSAVDTILSEDSKEEEVRAAASKIRMLLAPAAYLEKQQKNLDRLTSPDMSKDELKKILDLDKDKVFSEEFLTIQKSKKIKELTALLENYEDVDIKSISEKMSENVRTKMDRCEENIRYLSEEVDSGHEKLDREMSYLSTEALDPYLNKGRAREFEKYKEKTQEELKYILSNLKERGFNFKYVDLDAQEKIELIELSFREAKKKHGSSNWLRNMYEKERYLMFISYLEALGKGNELIIGARGKKPNLIDLTEKYSDLWDTAGSNYRDLLELKKNELSLPRDILSEEGKKGIVDKGFESTGENKETPDIESAKEKVYDLIVLLNNPLALRKRYQQDTGNIAPISRGDLFDIVRNEVGTDAYIEGSIKKLKEYKYLSRDTEQDTKIRDLLLREREDKVFRGEDPETAREWYEKELEKQTSEYASIDLEKKAEEVIVSLVAERMYRQDLPDFVEFLKSSRRIRVPSEKETTEESVLNEISEEQNIQGEQISVDAKAISDSNEENIQKILKYDTIMSKDEYDRTSEEEYFLKSYSPPSTPESTFESNSAEMAIRNAENIVEGEPQAYEDEDYEEYEDYEDYEDEESEDDQYVYERSDRGY